MMGAASENLVKNTVWSYIGNLVSVAVGFALVPVIVSQMGMEGYGLVQLLTLFSMTGYVSLLELGFQASITRYVAFFRSQDDREKLNQLCCSALLLFAGIGLSVAIIGVPLVDFFLSLFKVPGGQQQIFGKALLLTIVSYVFQFPTIGLVGILRGHQSFRMLKMVEIVSTLVRFAGIVAVCFTTRNFVHITLCMLAAPFFQFVIFMAILSGKPYSMRLSVRYFSWPILREIREMTGYVFLGKLSSLAFHHSDRVLIGIFLGPTQLAIYEMIAKVPLALKQVMGHIHTVVMPAASVDLKNAKDPNIHRWFFETGYRFQLFSAIPVALTLGLLADKILIYWIGPETAQYAYLMRAYLLINILMMIMSVGPTLILGKNEGLRSLTIQTLWSAAVNIVVTFFLIPPLGILGAIAGTLCALLVILPFQLPLCARVLHFRWSRFVRDNVTTGVSSVVVGALTYVVLNRLPHLSLIGVAAVAATSATSLWVILYFFQLDGDDRKLIVKWINQLRH